MKKISLFATVVISFTLIGCSQSVQLKGLVPASGTVIFNDQPVEGATIIFVPDSGNVNARSASATSGVNGKFTLMTLQPSDGAYPGSYKVTVEKTETTGDVWLEGTNERKTKLVDTRMITNMLPLKYRDQKTSDLLVEIPPKGNKNIELKLEGKADLTPKKPQGPGR